MKQLFNIAELYIQGQPIYPPLRRILNLLFNLSISSFIYQKFYGNYVWMDIKDYKGILDFFIKGQFFIPFSIFVVVYAITQSLANILFIASTHFTSVKYQRKIIAFKLEQDEVEEGFKQIEQKTKSFVPIDLTKDVLLSAYHTIRVQITEEVFNELKTSLDKPKKVIEENFIVVFRGIIAISVYACILSEFSRVLYFIVLLVGVAFLLLCVIGHCLFDLIPTFLKRFHNELEEYIMKRK